jgi:hypothetical protein
MHTRKGLLLLALLVLVAGGYWVYRLTRPQLSDPEQIKHAIVDAAGALEQHRVQSFMRVIADDYNDGTCNRQELEQQVRGAVLGTDQLRVVPYLRDLQVQGATATATIDADVIVSAYRYGPGPNEPYRSRYTIQTTWRKAPRGWQITCATGWETPSGKGN